MQGARPVGELCDVATRYDFWLHQECLTNARLHLAAEVQLSGKWVTVWEIIHLTPKELASAYMGSQHRDAEEAKRAEESVEARKRYLMTNLENNYDWSKRKGSIEPYVRLRDELDQLYREGNIENGNGFLRFYDVL